MIEKLTRETAIVSILGVFFALETLYSLFFRFDFFEMWLMLGFFTYCCFVYIKGNLKAIRYYKKKFENSYLDNQ